MVIPTELVVPVISGFAAVLAVVTAQILSAVHGRRLEKRQAAKEWLDKFLIFTGTADQLTARETALFGSSHGLQLGFGRKDQAVALWLHTVVAGMEVLQNLVLERRQQGVESCVAIGRVQMEVIDSVVKWQNGKLRSVDFHTPHILRRELLEAGTYISAHGDLLVLAPTPAPERLTFRRKTEVLEEIALRLGPLSTRDALSALGTHWLVTVPRYTLPFCWKLAKRAATRAFEKASLKAFTEVQN